MTWPRVTHTKTYALMDPWAQTIPWDCLIRDTNCCHPTHDHDTMANDLCAATGCGHLLLADEVCYYVTELPHDHTGREQAVCWRHIRPDDGPLRVTPRTLRRQR
jgi:hypothetical protein